MRLLLVEDDFELAAGIASVLAEQGFRVVHESTFLAGRSRAVRGGFEVIILGALLPGGSGFDLCRSLRKREVGTPVLMLTADDAVDDRVRGLDAGADDSLTKPFAFRELVARVRALARRRPTPLPEKATVADLEVDFWAHRARRGGRLIELTAKEFAFLEFLLRHRDQFVERAAIMAYVWDGNHDPYTNVLDVLVRRVRRKIDDGFDVKLIRTRRGVGYRLGT